MRNIRAYPVTAAEIDAALDAAAKRLLEEDRGIGDVSAYALSRAREIVKAAFGMVDGIEKRHALKDGFMQFTTPWDSATDLYKACYPFGITNSAPRHATSTTSPAHRPA